MRPLSGLAVLEIWERGQGRHAVDRALAILATAFPEHSLAELAALSVGERDALNWLRVLDTAELAQIDHRIPQQLHPIVALLDAFKAEQQPLELIFPRKGPLDPHA